MRRQASLVLSLSGLLCGGAGGFGCAAGAADVQPRTAAESRPDASPVRPPAAREASSPRAEGAAYLTLRVSPTRNGEAEPEDRTAAILSASARCPADMAFVDNRVCVDRWEASLVERVRSGARTIEQPWSPFLPVDGHERGVRAVSKPGVIPQAYISGKQAAAACFASGKRLCAAEEWERACRGPSNFQFPYGDQRRAGACNDDVRSLHPVAEVGRLLGIGGARLWREGMNEALINQLPNTLLPTGTRAECTNEYGVYDMVGNLHEWVDDADGTFRGGYYMDTTKNGDGCSYRTTAHSFTYHDYSTGFRCCMDPERVE